MKFHSQPLVEHEEVPLADEGRLEHQVEDWSRRAPQPGAKPEDGQNACYVVSVSARAQEASAKAQLAELIGLVDAQGDVTVGHELLRRERVDPRTYVGRGHAEAIAERANAAGANMLVLDAQLSPSQTRNLEDLTGFAICDREAVILNVFLRHAKTRRARIQVEIAQLEYLRPRIRGIGLDMDQQAGGIMGGRGPGETASELLARRLDGRLLELRKQCTKLERSGERQRSARSDCGRVVLVGYTNAGKTSLMNGLTRAELSARDRPFETLDTTTRSLTRRGGDVVISDTVGFIRNLPQRLLASFETTLAEIREATLIVLVVDLSDLEWARHLEITEAMLDKLEAGANPRIYVFNKLDRLAQAPDPESLRARSQGHPYRALSSHDAEAVGELRELLISGARPGHRSARVCLPYAASAAISAAYSGCEVSESEAGEHGLKLTLTGPSALVAELIAAGEELRV